MKAYKLQSKNGHTTRYAAGLDEVVDITGANRKFAGRRLNELENTPWVVLKGWLLSIIRVDESSIREEKTND